MGKRQATAIYPNEEARHTRLETAELLISCLSCNECTFRVLSDKRESDKASQPHPLQLDHGVALSIKYQRSEFGQGLSTKNRSIEHSYRGRQRRTSCHRERVSLPRLAYGEENNHAPKWYCVALCGEIVVSCLDVHAQRVDGAGHETRELARWSGSLFVKFLQVL